MERPFYVGIDLGTTNSAACVFDGQKLESVRAAGGGALTPSVVRFDARGNATVGARAYRHLQRDPDNTRGEFKRLMGAQYRYHFRAANLDKAPEELAACVLSSLRSDVEAQLGVRPERAVVAVPALFELPQIKATSEAARLAGFGQIETIQEPVASALAAGWSAEECQGPWLVYDLGGGTFDASLLEGRDGLLRVIGHDGDNFLGGRDFDVALVDHLVAKLGAETGTRLERANPAHASALARLKAFAEEAKIELSRSAETLVVVEGLDLGAGELDAHELALTQDELGELVAPLVERSIRVCERLLAAHGVKKLERIVLVGGPTLMPALRARLEHAFGAPFGVGLDPMQLVAQGAALFAATAALDARPQAVATAPKGPKLWLQFPAMTPDTSPFVVGRALDAADGVKAVRFARPEPAWDSDWVPLEADGTFATMLALERRCSNRFHVEVRLGDGRSAPADPAEVTLVHGVSIGEPPLARTIGIARADDGVAVYFTRGSPLPMRKTFTHRTVQAVSPNNTDFALRVPIVQGDFPFAHLCRLVGVIEIPAARLHKPLPVGSAIELTLEVDRGGALSVTALVPAQDLVFDRIEQLVAPAPAPEAMGVLVDELRRRGAELRQRGFRAGGRDTLKALADFEQQLEAILRDVEAARGGDQDAAEKARRGIIDCDGLLGELEAANAWPELNAEVALEHTSALYWVQQFGTELEKRALEDAVAAMQRAVRAKNAQDIERQLGGIRNLRVVCYLRHPEAWTWELDAAANRVAEATEPAQAQALLQKARKAEQGGNRSELERLVRQLWALFPSRQEERALGFDSGVR
jgi:molecular chaperone DnaK